ncbi:MAG TPA: ComEC/Rec2 family competence protein [Acidimicrobiia bacterium]|nr:ComEC/Rec2 family competence protein [Acidimicrobiia bacterium]
MTTTGRFRLKWPEGPGRRGMLALAAVWGGVLAGRHLGWWLLPLFAIAVLHRRRPLVAAGMAFCLAGLIAGWWSGHREQRVIEAVVPEGPARLVVAAVTDPIRGDFGDVWFLARPQAVVRETIVSWRGPTLLVSVEEAGGLTAGSWALVEGRLRGGAGWARGSPYAGRLQGTEVEVIDGSAPGPVQLANGIRRRIIGGLDTADPAQALLAGFLVGATDDLPAVDYEALRRSGLAHFVAVSGSNVALFLSLWWLLLGPLGMGRWRGLAGLAGLGLFVIVTRWEPSVVRASLMAGLVLGGRLLGWPLDSFTALSAGAILALLVSPELAVDVGFQLSVLATGGILLAPRLESRWLPRWLAAPLMVTCFAQLAVLPLLLLYFGSVPLLAPLTNLIAAPLVALSTTLGGLGTLTGVTPLVQLGRLPAWLVLELARTAQGWPQLDHLHSLVLIGGLLLARSPRLRPVVVAAAALALSWPLLTASPPPRLSAVFLDVGQGDATLLIGRSGEVVLVDGGPDPVILQAALDRYRVRSLALVVVTHAHEDHVRGLTALPGRYPVSRLWYPGPPHSSPAWEDLTTAAAAAAIPLTVPAVGTTEHIDGLSLVVAGPKRRYEGINDQSIVLWVTAGASRILLTGDVERAAQADLGPLSTDVLKVPHHGATTSDLAWLQATRSRLAVISVGENDYGHPAPEVLDALSGAVVVRTDEAGDIVVPLVGDPLSRLPAGSAGRSRRRGRSPGRALRHCRDRWRSSPSPRRCRWTGLAADEDCRPRCGRRRRRFPEALPRSHAVPRCGRGLDGRSCGLRLPAWYPSLAAGRAGAGWAGRPRRRSRQLPPRRPSRTDRLATFPPLPPPGRSGHCRDRFRRRRRRRGPFCRGWPGSGRWPNHPRPRTRGTRSTGLRSVRRAPGTPPVAGQAGGGADRPAPPRLR